MECTSERFFVASVLFLAVWGSADLDLAPSYWWVQICSSVFHPLGAAAWGMFFLWLEGVKRHWKNRNTFKTSIAVKSVSISLSTETSHMSKLVISGVGKLSSWSRGKEYLLNDGLICHINSLIFDSWLLLLRGSFERARGTQVKPKRKSVWILEGREAKGRQLMLIVWVVLNHPKTRAWAGDWQSFLFCFLSRPSKLLGLLSQWMFLIQNSHILFCHFCGWHSTECRSEMALDKKIWFWKPREGEEGGLPPCKGGIYRIHLSFFLASLILDELVEHP